MNLKGTKTEQNLMVTFAGKSKAKKEGYNKIAYVFK